jgi:hypothetical protein
MRLQEHSVPEMPLDWQDYLLGAFMVLVTAWQLVSWGYHAFVWLRSILL